MRITSSMLASNFMTNIQSNLQRMEKYQNQLSTGKNFSRPSDDPVAVTRSLQVRTD
ncbi:MAG: flagellar hook-associated protein FlgL, partial [Firmicutes bacterium]|nr:flagellar hook-associated protein FlgL [Bacillota bacterium]